MSTTIYPAADHTTQWFGDDFSGSLMTPNCLGLHSTEGYGWPGYAGGGTAPHFTIRPDFATKTVKVRQHFALNRSARSFVNLAGGVETNTLNVVQIELVGTCDPATHLKWEAAGIAHIYMPEAPDWFLAGIAQVLRWFDASWPAFKIVDGAPRGWLSYPKSYGNVNGQRMTFSEWANCYGIVGHQHVPENAHGDPGKFPIVKLIALAGGTVEPIPEPPTVVPTWGQPSTWVLGATGPDVLRLGDRINAWNAVLGLPTWLPDDTFSTTEQKALSALQVAWGFGSAAADLAAGGASDGFPGSLTFSKLEETPMPIAEPGPIIVSASMNEAGYNERGSKTYGTRTDLYAARRLEYPVDVINFQELAAGKTTTVDGVTRYSCPMRQRMDDKLSGVYTRRGGGEGRQCYLHDTRVTFVAGGVFEAAAATLYNGDDKQAAWVVYNADDVLGMDVSYHLEHEAGATADSKRVQQMLNFVSQALAKAQALGVDPRNVMLVGDGNSEQMVKTAMWQAGWRDVADGTDLEDDYTFMGWDGLSRKCFDRGYVLKTAAPARLSKINRSTTMSDHGEILVRRQLTRVAA